MYANLKVAIDGKPFYAWKVEVLEDETILYLDGNDGIGGYAEPIGEKRVPHDSRYQLMIYADF